MTALSQARTGRMRDIVATVQAEQDEIIRADLQGILAVQGGPGTGKTAVALHRAAYLLFTYRRQLGREGILVVGPNTLFLSYIDQVLPALGESGGHLVTINGLVDGVRATGTDTLEPARVKSDARMQHVIAKAVRDRERPLRRDIVVAVGPYKLSLSAEDSVRIVADARRRRGTHNSRRRIVETLVMRRLWDAYVAAADAAHHLRGLSRRELAREVRDDKGLRASLERMWPVLSPQELLHDLFGAPALLRVAAEGTLKEREWSALHRARCASWRDVAWTPADLPLLDEAADRLGPVPLTAAQRALTPEDDEDSEPWTYGHIVVDEAQDLSPMQLRMLGRRSRSGSMTLVGDVAQATGNWAPTAWEEVLNYLPTRRGARVSELSINYRTPSEIMDVAASVLAVVAPGLEPSRSVRATGEVPVFDRVDAAGVECEAAAYAASELVTIGAGTVAVICARSQVDPLSDALSAAGVEFGEATRAGLGAPVTLVSVDIVKGLEFDSIVVVEPARIVRESAQGMRALYVALTRATRRLTVVHAEALPRGLADR